MSGINKGFTSSLEDTFTEEPFTLEEGLDAEPTLEEQTAFYRRMASRGQWNNYEGPTVEQMYAAFDEWLRRVREQAVEEGKG